MTTSTDDTPKGELSLYQAEDGRTRHVPAFEAPAPAEQNAPTFALPPATAPTPRTTALGAPRANVGALVAFIGESELARLQRAVLLSDRVNRASTAERSTLRRGTRRPFWVGVSSKTKALRGASMMPGRRRASSGNIVRLRSSKPTASTNHCIALAAYMRPVPTSYAWRTMYSKSARTASARRPRRRRTH